MIKHSIVNKVLSNGVGLFIVHTPSTEMAKLSITVRDGFGYSKKDIFELPHLLEHLAFEGNEYVPDSAVLANKIESLGAYQNAYTATDKIGYFYEAPYTNIVSVAELALQQFSKPIFTENSITQEKLVVLRELESKMDNDFFRLHANINTLLEPDLYPDIEDRLKTVSIISREQILNHYKKSHYANNTRVMLSGNINPKKQALIEELILKLIPADKKKQQEKIVFDFDTNKFNKVFYLDAIRPNQAAVSINFYWNQDDLKERVIMGLISTMLSDGTGSSFFQKVRRSGLTYGTSSSFDWSTSLAEFSINDQTKSADMPKLLDLILSTVQDFGKGGFEQSEIDRAKQQILASIKSRLDSASGIMSFYANRYLEDLPSVSIKEQLDMINDINRSDILSAINKYFYKNYVIGMALKDKKDTASLQAALKKYFSV